MQGKLCITNCDGGYIQSDNTELNIYEFNIVKCNNNTLTINII